MGGRGDAHGDVVLQQMVLCWRGVNPPGNEALSTPGVALRVDSSVWTGNALGWSRGWPVVRRGCLHPQILHHSPAPCSCALKPRGGCQALVPLLIHHRPGAAFLRGWLLLSQGGCRAPPKGVGTPSHPPRTTGPHLQLLSHVGGTRQLQDMYPPRQMRPHAQRMLLGEFWGACTPGLGFCLLGVLPCSAVLCVWGWGV